MLFRELVAQLGLAFGGKRASSNPLGPYLVCNVTAPLGFFVRTDA